MISKIAIFNWGQISIHSYYLAMQLTKAGMVIDFYLYTPMYLNSESYPHYLLADLKKNNINIVEIKCTPLEAKIIKLHRIAELFNYPLPSVFTNIFLPRKTRKAFKSINYKYVIPVSHFSLFWLYKTAPTALSKAIYYSLEIFKITDPYIKKHSWLYSIINLETKLLNYVKGIIIQDKLRLQALFNNTTFRNDLRVFYLPVGIPGNSIQAKSHYLHKNFNLNHGQKIILYFGAEYKERKLEELISAFGEIRNSNLVLIIHGAGDLPQIIKPPNVKISTESLKYHHLHLIISSATIGIALYDNGWANSRLTAFSSEKIARYLQAGIPFIGFRNESYINLKNEYNCCELIDNVSQLEHAITIILNNYNFYTTNCFMAYNKYYNIQYTTKALTQFLTND